MASMIRALIALACFVLSTQTPVTAAPVVVEVFANQNCGACPKAHENMATLEATRDDVLIVTWSVDYWDYLGAPDPMAMPEAKARQMAYADRFELRGPYTPQSVFNGETQCPGNKMRRVTRAIKAAQSEGGTEFKVAEDGTVTLAGAHDGPLDVVLLTFADLPGSDMVNPVLSADYVGAFDGAELSLRTECDGRCALIAQEPDYGVIRAGLMLE
ncbi:MAG: DUF1223 domain-containing protein [Pseudomonadota bacterium]